MAVRKTLESLVHQHGFEDFKWIDPQAITVRNWVRMKCLFGCPDYGQNAACPPNVPSIAECREFMREYRHIVVFHFSALLDDPAKRHAWTRKINRRLLELERKIFWQGYHKAFLLFLDSCTMCKDCSQQRQDCQKKQDSRPTPEALGIDVFETVRRISYPIEVLSSYDQMMNRYAFLFIE